MKRLITILSIVLLSSCGLRENLLAPPDETEVPDSADVAECGTDIKYKFVYESPVLYLYYIDGILQSEDLVSDIQEEIILAGESMPNYLELNFNSNECTFSDYK